MPVLQISIRVYRLWLAILALLGVVLVLITTSKYGAGVSSDAVRAMSTAEGLLAGRGFVDFTGARYVLWPPLYPLLLAGSSMLTRLDVFHAAWALNVLLFPVNTWLWGLYFERVFPGKLLYGLAASAIAVLSSSMLRIYANVASDPLFVTFVVLFLLTVSDYGKKPSSRGLWAMFLLAGLAMLQRYLGVVLMGVAAVEVLLARGRRGLLEMLLPAGVSALPLGVWLVGHNYLLNGTFFGTRAYNEMWPLENLSLSMTKVLHWFLPYAPGLKTLLLHPSTIVLGGLAMLVLLTFQHPERWERWGRSLVNARTRPLLLFTVVYYLLLAFTVNTIDHRDLTSDRYYIILLQPILVILFLAWDHLAAPALENLGAARVALGVLALAWFAYPVYDLQEYLRLALVNGEPSNYNIYNSSHFIDMEVVKEGLSLVEQHPDAAVYSNYVNLLWFQYKRPIHTLLPVDHDLAPEARAASLRAEYPGWPSAGPGYLVWFTPNEYKYLAGPEDLGEVADLRLIYRDDNGEIYEIRPK